MKFFRLHFRAPDSILEGAHWPYASMRNADLPISKELRSRVDELSRFHSESVAKNAVPSDEEKREFQERYNTVVPALEEALRDYGQIVDEVKPDVFEPWFGAKDLEQMRLETAKLSTHHRVVERIRTFATERLRKRDGRKR